jgi:D-amino peptidase
MKIFISADIEGVNSITSWSETDAPNAEYQPFKKQMNAEVAAACRGALKAGATKIFVKDAHDSAKNLDINLLPKEVILHRGWEGSPASMMAGLNTDSFDAALFIGYHSAAGCSGNTLSHTMNTRLNYIKINGELASEFTINSLYASYLGIPIAFLSGDEALTKSVQRVNPNIKVVATKAGSHGATISKHPEVTNKEIEEKVERALKELSPANLISLPNKFNIEINFKNHVDAYGSSFFPGCKLKDDYTVTYTTKNYYDAMIMFKFVL